MGRGRRAGLNGLFIFKAGLSQCRLRNQEEHLSCRSSCDKRIRKGVWDTVFSRLSDAAIILLFFLYSHVELSYTIDTRDAQIFPRKGGKFEVLAGYSGLGPTAFSSITWLCTTAC